MPNIIKVNQAFMEMTGYRREALLGKNPKILKSGQHGKAFDKDLCDAFRDKWILAERDMELP